MSPVSLIAQLINFALALVFWMILGRILLTAITGGHEGFFMGVFRKATDPAYALVRRVTGERVGELGVAVIALLLVVVLRISLLPLLRE